MTPIHELLSRIRWDEEFGQALFEIGYYDRVADAIQFVSFNDLRFPEELHGFFELTDQNDHRVTIPFHRVREVYRDGSLIWQRPVTHG